MLIERKTTESELDFHRRLVYGKLVDKTLADVDYSELSDLVYGQHYSSDVARRMLYGSKRTLELMDEERVSGAVSEGGQDFIDELDAKLAELKREQQKFYDQRREYNKLLNSDGRAEHLHQIIVDAAANLGDTVGKLYNEDRPMAMYGTNEAVCVFSDWHYGMKASNVFNEYNTEICKQRVAEAVRRMVERIEANHCNVAHVVVLGDIFHGAIHVSARVASDEVVCEQIMHASEILAQSIHEISKHVSEVRVYMTYGNHGRTVQNKKDNIHRDNMERLVPWWLEERFKDNPSVIIMPESDTEFIMMNVCGHGFCASHGDLDNVKSSPRLLGTLFHKKLGVDVEYILLGDKHHRESFNELGIDSMICGSLCGTDDYANDHRLYSSPSQLLLIVNEECGVDAEYNIKV